MRFSEINKPKLNEDVGGNYLYHATGGLKKILSTGRIFPAHGPQDATKAQTTLPTVSTTRDWNYASGGESETEGVDSNAVIVLDRNAVESNFKTLGTSQSRDVRGLAHPQQTNLDAVKTARSYDVDNNKVLNKKDADELFAKGSILGRDGKPVSREVVGRTAGAAKQGFYSSKAGGEFEEAIVVPETGLPIARTMFGFWVNPQSQLTKDPEIMNDPRRLELAPGGTGRFVKAKQQQGVSEDANPKRQAAIAIAMKKAGKKPKDVAEGEGGLGQVAGIGINGKQFNFSIKDLIAKAQNYPIKKLNPQLFVKQLADRHEDPKQTAARAQSADLQYPIIVVQDGNTLMIADGTHRAQKAIMNKLPSINAYVIPVEDIAEFSKQGVAEGSQEINWVKPNFDFEWHEVEEQSRMKQVPVDVRQYYQKHFPNKDAWLKAVQNGKAVVVPPDHAYEIRNAPFDKVSLQKVLAPTGHEGPIGPAKEKRVNDLFDKGQVEMPIILKTSQGLWLIGGKTRLGTANYVKGLPAKVWLISGEQGVAEGMRKWLVIHNGSHGEGGKMTIEAPDFDTAWKLANEYDLDIIEVKPVKGVAEGSLNEFAPYDHNDDGDYDDEGDDELRSLYDTKFELEAELDYADEEDREHLESELEDVHARILELKPDAILEQGVAEGLPGSLSKSDYTLGATVKNPNTSCKRCNGRGTLWKAPDGKILPANDVPGAKKYKCGACDGIGMAKKEVDEGENWSKYNHKRVGGMSKKSVSSYRRSHPGSKIQTAVTTKPSKLKKGSKAAKRRASFCARMRGMKKHRTSAKTARDPNSNINKSLRRWHCESIEELHELVMLAEQFIKNNKK